MRHDPSIPRLNPLPLLARATSRRPAARTLRCPAVRRRDSIGSWAWVLRAACLGLLLTSGAAGLWAQDSTSGDQEDSLERDYENELPRIDPVEPADALATFAVAEGFRIELVASEPLVTDPVAIDFDPDGVLYAIEMRDYSEHPDESLGQVRRLIDTDGDGVYDESQVFADRLSWPTAILCVDQGVLVGAPPELIFLRDTDSDGVADERRVLMTGFGRSNVQGLMNSLRFGLDHRIHGAVSSSGASLRWADVESSEPLELRGRDFAIDWRTRELSATAGGGQHGADFDRWGDRFVCSNSDHLRYVRYEDRYLSRNPWFAAPAGTVSIAADGPQADVFRISPVEPWRIVRTRLRRQGIVPGPVEGGGRAAGYFTGATGVTLYQPWPGEQETEWAIVADVGSNLVHRKRLTREGNSYVGERIDAEREFVASSDIWFRPVQFSVGPEGGLYIVDMYREVIEHPASLHPVIKQHLDLDSGRDRGRIYRVVPESFEYPGQPRLAAASLDELIATLDDPRVWRRRTATRLIIERGDRGAIEPLASAFRSGATSPEARLHMLSALDALGGLDEALLEQGLADTHAEVRRWSARWCERIESPSAALVRSLAALADDEDLRVRTQAAFSLGRFRGVAADGALARIAVRDFEDGVTRVAVTTSLGSGATSVIEELILADRVRESEVGATWLGELLNQVLARREERERVDLVRWIEQWPTSHPAAARWLERALGQLPAEHPWRESLEEAQGPEAMARREAALATALRLAVDADADEAERAVAVLELKRAPSDNVIDFLARLTDPLEPSGVQRAAVETLLSHADQPRVATLLIERWSGLSPDLRRATMDGLLQRVTWTTQVLEALSDGRLAMSDLERTQLARLANHSDATIRELAMAVIGAPGPRDELIEQYREALTMEGDANRGSEVFRRVCANCHRVGEVGHEVGPSLASFRNRGPEALLLNVLDPNREINPQFLAYGAETTDGRQVVGMIGGETASSVTLKMAEGKVETLRRAELETLSSTGVSLMPEGLEKDVDVQAMADLLAFLLQGDG